MNLPSLVLGGFDPADTSDPEVMSLRQQYQAQVDREYDNGTIGTHLGTMEPLSHWGHDDRVFVQLVREKLGLVPNDDWWT